MQMTGRRECDFTSRMMNWLKRKVHIPALTSLLTFFFEGAVFAVFTIVLFPRDRRFVLSGAGDVVPEPSEGLFVELLLLLLLLAPDE